MPLTLYSPAFGSNAGMPRRFTCDGANVSPPLQWTELPPGTRSLAIVVEDPDAPDPAAPTHTFVHWLVYDIPAIVRELPEGAARSLPNGARHGTNDHGTQTWYGPCPPVGEHRYFFKLYALDVMLDLEHPTKERLLAAMDGHILAKSELIGRYGRTSVTAG